MQDGSEVWVWVGVGGWGEMVERRRSDDVSYDNEFATY